MFFDVANLDTKPSPRDDGLVPRLAISTVIDFPELRYQGKLRPILFISTAWIIGSYNKVVRDVTAWNIIVAKVMKEAE